MFDLRQSKGSLGSQISGPMLCKTCGEPLDAQTPAKEDAGARQTTDRSPHHLSPGTREDDIQSSKGQGRHCPRHPR
jgi:hypothetical protein